MTKINTEIKTAIIPNCNQKTRVREMITVPRLHSFCVGGTDGSLLSVLLGPCLSICLSFCVSTCLPVCM